MGSGVQLSNWFEEDFRGNGQSKQRCITEHEDILFSFSDSVLFEAISSRKIQTDPENQERHSRSLVRVSSFSYSLFSVDEFCSSIADEKTPMILVI